MTPSPDPDIDPDLEVVASLAEPVRRALYDYVAASREAVSREQAAGAVGVSRQVAAYHLDRLADDGLLELEFRRLTGREGPGPGDPPSSTTAPSGSTTCRYRRDGTNWRRGSCWRRRP